MTGIILNRRKQREQREMLCFLRFLALKYIRLFVRHYGGHVFPQPYPLPLGEEAPIGHFRTFLVDETQARELFRG
jgi:hypothetical protein